MASETELRELDHGGARKEITVLGAGVAGLVAAYELRRLGHHVRVFEGSFRIGGRVYTHRFGTGQDAPFAELGAMRLPTDHRNTMHYVRELGLIGQLRPFQTLLSDSNTYLSTAEGPARISEASPALVAGYRRRFPVDGYRDETVLFATWLAAVVEAISPASLRRKFGAAEVQAAVLTFVDATDVRPYLPAPGRTVDLSGFFAEHPGLRATLGPAVGCFVDDILTETSTDLVHLDGGMDQIVTGLAERIGGGIHRRHHVTGLTVRPDDVTIELIHKDRVMLVTSEYVLCTIPFSALRNVCLNGVDDDKADTIRDTRYCSATKVAFHCREPFWENEGITGGASFSGGSVRQTYYPAAGPAGRGAALLASYTIGEEADRLGRMPPEARHAFVRGKLGEMHPALLRPGMVLEAVSMAWGQHSWHHGGCCVRWNMDDRCRDNDVYQAYRPQNRLFFAGEHCSVRSAWIDGAIESALCAVRDIAAHRVRPKPIFATGLDARVIPA